jgi:hypothetical protein
VKVVSVRLGHGRTDITMKNRRTRSPRLRKKRRRRCLRYSGDKTSHLITSPPYELGWRVRRATNQRRRSAST